MEHSIFCGSRAYKIVSADIAGGTVSHAYLFVCPDERNLRSFLKELAKLILRADARASRLIEEERYADCRMFPAPGGKATVADVKELLDDCYIRPTETDSKLFVFDRMQEMLPPAQNKLLKVLEEPPQNVRFLLGTTSEFPVLTTVKSRAKRLDLYPFPASEIEKYLQKAYPFCNFAHEIAAISDGNLGKAQELAESGFGGEDESEMLRFISNLSPSAIPSAVRKYSDKAQALRFLAMFRLILRDMFMVKLGKEELLLSGAARDMLVRVSSRFTQAGLVRAQEGICALERDLRFNANIASGLETLFVAILEGR